MSTEPTKQGLRRLGVISMFCGILGGAFYWWVPFGIVVSLSGLVVGFVDWTMARRRSLDYRLSIVTILICIVALALDGVIAGLGKQTVTFGGQ